MVHKNNVHCRLGVISILRSIKFSEAGREWLSALVIAEHLFFYLLCISC